ncbi:Transient receptor potential cation channel subfamily A member 1 [Eumeta japonica]|uniref:Transient receptor potential cation channel subfamily A member 1 n=1 Tax=Eumeta variegata TaxID=151549 RepID=A0A4C2A3I1_EUMVA|nr:Transient receptor potential cation channel subfamily A member 1 [Eumeta japonica]
MLMALGNPSTNTVVKSADLAGRLVPNESVTLLNITTSTTTENFDKIVTLYTSMVAILIYIAICAVREVINVKEQKWHYLIDPANFVSLALYISSAVMVLPSLDGQIHDIQFTASSITVFLAVEAATALAEI